MQAIIMAAGRGSRLGELTKELPKTFVEIKGKKIIEHILSLLRHYGIKDIIIVTGFRQDAFEESFGGMSDISLAFNPFYEMTNVLGSFYMGMDDLEDDFVYIHGDTICAPEIFEKMLASDGDLVLPIDFSGSDEEAMKIKIEDGRICRISKQIPLEESAGEFIGAAFFRKSVIPALKRVTKQLMVEKDFTGYFEDAIQRIIDDREFSVKPIATDGAFWAEIDFVEDYERACKNMPTSF